MQFEFYICLFYFIFEGQNLIHELPESFGNLCSLRVCLLSKNHLQLLPSSFGNLASLEDVRLDDNEVRRCKIKTKISGCVVFLSDEILDFFKKMSQCMSF